MLGRTEALGRAAANSGSSLNDARMESRGGARIAIGNCCQDRSCCRRESSERNRMPTRNISLTPEQDAFIKAGVAALDRGAYTEVDEEDLDAYLDNLAVQTDR
jgi:hypothetical protein